MSVGVNYKPTPWNLSKAHIVPVLVTVNSVWIGMSRSQTSVNNIEVTLSVSVGEYRANRGGHIVAIHNGATLANDDKNASKINCLEKWTLIINRFEMATRNNFVRQC